MKTATDCAISLNVEDKEILDRLGIIAVYLFGSRAQGVASPLSDFDFGILMDDDIFLSAKEQAVYSALYSIFSSYIKPETQEADVIDIVFLQSQRVPLELKAYIISHGTLLYDSKPLTRATIEERILLQNADFAPLKEEMRQTLLSRL